MAAVHPPLCVRVVATQLSTLKITPAWAAGGVIAVRAANGTMVNASFAAFLARNSFARASEVMMVSWSRESS